MAYIGRPSIVGNFVKLDAITAVNGQAAYTMQNNSANFADYSTVNQFLVSLNGTIQSPGSSFTVSGSTLTFASNLSTGDVIDFIIVFGNSLSAGVPTDDTVSTAKIVDDAVTAAKINNDIISGSTELATAPADTDEFLVSDAGTIKRIDYSLIKSSAISEFDLFRLTADTSSGSNADITTNLERDDTYSGLDKIGTGMTESSGVFTFPSTGKYEVFVIARMRFTATDQNARVEILVSTDGGSSYNDAAYVTQGTVTGGNAYMIASNLKVLNVTDISNIKVKFATASFASGNFLTGHTDINLTTFKFTKLGD